MARLPNTADLMTLEEAAGDAGYSSPSHPAQGCMRGVPARDPTRLPHDPHHCRMGGCIRGHRVRKRRQTTWVHHVSHAAATTPVTDVPRSRESHLEEKEESKRYATRQ
jgi:hypothetical protein